MSKNVHTIRGITWGHIRAIDPLMASAAHYAYQQSSYDVQWSIRSLACFEHQSIEELVQDYDMIVFDHPYVGRLAQETLFEPLELPTLSPEKGTEYIGQSLASYRYAGKTWGAPVDGATNHAVYRADVLKELGEAVPVSWGDAVSLGRKLRTEGKFLGMAAKGHHGLLVVAALCANLGAPFSTDASQPFFVHEEALAQAIEALKELLRYAEPNACDWNSITLHNHMATRHDIVYCPCVYGFSVYGEPEIYEHRLSFANFAGLRPPHHAGSVLGGAAIGLSAFSTHKHACLNYINWLMQPHVQKAIISANHGQAGRIESWDDRALHTQTNGFYSSVKASMETAWMRPRFFGYQNFEMKAGEVLEACLRDQLSTTDAVGRITALAQSEFVTW